MAERAFGAEEEPEPPWECQVYRLGSTGGELNRNRDAAINQWSGQLLVFGGRRYVVIAVEDSGDTAGHVEARLLRHRREPETENVEFARDL
jgi:hypothetical protein